jgi:hypothetical protein
VTVNHSFDDVSDRFNVDIICISNESSLVILVITRTIPTSVCNVVMVIIGQICDLPGINPVTKCKMLTHKYICRHTHTCVRACMLACARVPTCQRKVLLPSEHDLKYLFHYLLHKFVAFLNKCTCIVHS